MTGVTSKEDNSITTISVGQRWGCVEVLDMGKSYGAYIRAGVKAIEDEKEYFNSEIKAGNLKKAGWEWGELSDSPVGEYTHFIYCPKTFHPHTIGKSEVAISLQDFDYEIKKLQPLKDGPVHYKCICRYCGKIRYYTEETLFSKPSFCYRPIYHSNKFTYSYRAKKSSRNKEMKYFGNESVVLLDSKDLIVPDEKYCDRWNKKQEEKLAKDAEKKAAIIAEIPRRYAKNYDIDYTGMRYESFDVLECINDHDESAPIPYWTQQHKKKYYDITVYKTYRCRCYICNKEKNIRCSDFGIFPPDEYGIHAYDGYWSKVKCDCHQLSSFQWIVNKILIENKIPYRVEVTFPDLYGSRGKNLLSFDFAIYKLSGEIKCLLECQGEQHYKAVDEFGGERQYKYQTENDNIKRQYARNHNIPLIEISYREKKYEKVEEILRKNGIIP